MRRITSICSVISVFLCMSFALRLLCLACWKGKLSHVTVCFVWRCFALFVGRELPHVTVCFVLFVGEGNCHTLRFALFRVALVCFVFLVRSENCHMLRFAVHCVASLCIALLALHCIALLICGMRKN